MSESFAGVLRRAREAAGLTQAALAERAGLGERTVSNLERGVNTSPYPSTVRLLADALDLSEPARHALVAASRRAEGTGERAAPTGGYLGARPATPIVAREPERTAIDAALAVIASGHGRTLLFSGEPGIGKTRLAQELTDLATQRGFVVATGRCYAPLSGTPYTPFLEALASLHAASPSPVRDAVAERWPPLTTLLPDEFPRGDLWSGSSSDAAQRLHRAVAAFVREMAKDQPVVIVVDDLHWADPASLELLEHLARHTVGERVLLAGTHRNVELRRNHPALTLQREGLVESVSVGRLDLPATAHLLRQRLDDASITEEFSALVHEHAAGNPFFTVEIVAALIERGDLARIDGRWVRRELAELVAPTSVQDAVAERVSGLSPGSQKVLEAASVLGEVFSIDDLTITELDDEAVETALDEAVSAGLLTADETHYAFDHGLTQSALYAALSPAGRRRLHRAAGDALLFKPQAVRRRRAAEIALHLERGGVPQRAVLYLLLAGDAALGMYSHAQALGHYRHGLALADEAGDEAASAEADERLGQLLLATASYDEALIHLVRAADAHRRTADHVARLRVEGMIAMAHHRRGAGEAAEARLVEVVAELDGADVPGVSALHSGLARVRLSLGELGQAVAAAERGAELARAHGLELMESDALALVGTTLLFLDRHDDAVAALERALTLGAAPETDTIHSGAILALTWARTMSGDLVRGRELAELGLEVTRRSGDSDAQALHSANLGLALFYDGDRALAREHLERGVALARSSGPTLFSSIPPSYLGLLLSAEGDLDGAEACYREAITAPDLQTFAFDAYVDGRLAELDVLRGEHARALARLEAWIVREKPSLLHDVMILTVAAQACLGSGDADRGARLSDRALDRARATRNEIDAVSADRVHAECLARLGG